MSGSTPDGPRGPRMRVQPGIIALARLSGAPILPFTFAVSRAQGRGSWDRFVIATAIRPRRLSVGTAAPCRRRRRQGGVGGRTSDSGGAAQRVDRESRPHGGHRTDRTGRGHRAGRGSACRDGAGRCASVIKALITPRSYRCASLLASPVVHAWLAHRLSPRQGGRVPAFSEAAWVSPSLPRPEGRLVWMHGS